MYVNVKIIPVETITGGEGDKGEYTGVNSSMIYFIHCKNLYKYHNLTPPSTTIKKSKHKRKIMTQTQIKHSQ
jgi:hypothetical protein